jgi:hypothetical protein
MAASVTHLPPVTPEPVPSSLLAPLAEYNLSQGMTPDWARSRWPEMADAMTSLALDTVAANGSGLILEAAPR